MARCSSTAERDAADDALADAQRDLASSEDEGSDGGCEQVPYPNEATGEYYMGPPDYEHNKKGKCVYYDKYGHEMVAGH